MRISRAIFLILLCLLSAGLVACGDDDNADGGSSSDEFIASADEICTEAAEEAVANPQPTPTTAEEAVSTLEVSVQRREDLLADFEDLGDPPSDIADEWNEYVDLVSQRAELTKQTLKFARQGLDPTTPRVANTVGKSSDLEQQGNEIMEGLGSEACAQVLAPEDRKEIVEFVTAWETEPFDDCEAVTTADGIELGWGSVAECQKAQDDARENPEGLTKSVKVLDVEGIAEVTATVDATLTGGVNDGSTLRYTVVFEDGGYKVDSVTLAPGETS